MIKNKFSKRVGAQVDSNIEPLVYFLNKNKVKTSYSCGHTERNYIILNNRTRIKKARKVINKLDIPKSADLKIYEKPKLYCIQGKNKGKPKKNSPTWRIIDFKRGYAHIIKNKLHEKSDKI
jgi:hypothetical protein